MKRFTRKSLSATHSATFYTASARLGCLTGLSTMTAIKRIAVGAEVSLAELRQANQ